MKLITVLATLLLSTTVFATEIPAEKPVERGQINFGTIPYNSSRQQVFTLKNNGTEPITDISLKISGDFTMRHKCPTVLNAGESCKAKITLWVNRQGGHMGRFTVRTSAKDYMYDLYGYGEKPFEPPHIPIPNPPHP